MNNKFENRINQIFTLSLIVLTLVLTQIVRSQPTLQPIEEWISEYKFSNNDKPLSMTMDSEGNIYVTGYSEGEDSGKDFLTIKYSPSGKELWSARFKGPNNRDGNDDVANTIILDNQNNVYVAGFTHGGVYGRDFCLIKYNSSGEQQWIVSFSGEGGIEDSDEEAVAITIDKLNYIYVTGYSNGRGVGYDFCTVKYNVNGNLIWVKSFDGGINQEDKAVSIKSDDKNNLIITGYSEGMNSGKDFCTVKYNSEGNILWSARYNGVAGNLIINNDDEVRSLAIDQNGYIFITGYSYGALTGKDFCTVKYSPEGKEEWVSRFDHPQSQEEIPFDDEAKALALDASGNVYVTGKTMSSLNGSDYLTIKIGLNGLVQWTNTYKSELYNISENAAEAITLDREGNIYVAGFINGEVSTLDLLNRRGKDFGTIKYNQFGEEKWVKVFNGSGKIGENDDVAHAIIVDSKDKIYVMGECMNEATKLDYCLIKYSESSSDTGALLKNSYKLNDNFPNPFNPTTKITFQISFDSKVKLAIYDISGKEIALLVNKILPAGNHQYEWNASQFATGTYFYHIVIHSDKIQTDEFIQTKKMILIK